MSSVHLVTGATSGLGLELVRLLLADPERRLIVGARHPEAAIALRRLDGSDRIRILPLDLTSLTSVADFAAAVIENLAGDRLASLSANAGLQTIGTRRLTTDGYEETFQVNYLGHAILIDRLQGHLLPRAPVVMTASGTHNPAHGLARRFGFRGGLFPDVNAVAHGDLDTTVSIKQQAMDRYATSKLCMILHAYARARGTPVDGPRFIAFDPGLMPGTGLARERSAIERWGWSNFLPLLARFIPGTSTPQRSAVALARLLTGEAFAEGTGLHVDFTLARTQSSTDSYRQELQQELTTFVRGVA